MTRRAAAIGAVILASLAAAPARAGTYSPYVDMTLNRDPMLPAIQRQTGARSLSLGFVVATGRACRPSWGGSVPIGSRQFQREVAVIRRSGAAPIVSFGGAAGPDLSRVCGATGQLTAAYREALSAYPGSQADFDLEGAALDDRAGSQREVLAVGGLERWAAGRHRALRVSFTLPVLPTGLPADSLRVLRLAHANHVRVDVVNVLAMDYGDSAAPPAGNTMSGYAIRAADATQRQLASLVPGAGFSRLGVTVMIGINDVSDEVFTTSDADAVLGYARARGLGRLGVWSAARDRPCPAPVGSAQADCSGVAQQPYEFSRKFAALG